MYLIQEKGGLMVPVPVQSDIEHGGNYIVLMDATDLAKGPAVLRHIIRRLEEKKTNYAVWDVHDEVPRHLLFNYKVT